MLCFAFGLVAEIERNLISMSTKEALALRKVEGVVVGRKKGSYTKMNVLIENRKVVVGMLTLFSTDLILFTPYSWTFSPHEVIFVG